MSRPDFIIILAPRAWIIRPISAGAKALVKPWAMEKVWLGQCLVIEAPSAFYDFLDQVNAAGCRIGVF